MASAQEIRDRLEGYARAKIASVMQPLTEKMLIDQPGDPIEYMVKYLVQNRSDLRKHVIKETLDLRIEGGRRSIPVVDHPLMDKIEQLEEQLKRENKFRRKENKAAALLSEKQAARIAELEARLTAAGIPLDPSIDKEMKAFLAWESKAVADSPVHPGDTEHFKFRTYTGFPPMTNKHKSMMKNLLKEDKFLECQGLVTSFGTTLSNFIQAGVTQPKLPFGVACGDGECASVFKELYLNMTKAIHGLDPYKEVFESNLSAMHVALGEEREAVCKEHLMSVRMKAVRNISGVPFLPTALDSDRLMVEEILTAAFAKLDGEVVGRYESFSELDPDEEDLLAEDELMLATPDDSSLAFASGAARGWPYHRGIFRDEERSVVCWVNGPEDHCTLLVLQRDHDIVTALRKMSELHHKIEEHLQSVQRRWVEHDTFGFLGACPSNSGTSFVCQAAICLPTAGKDSSLILGAVAHLNLKLEKVKVDLPEGAEKAKIGSMENWKLTHNKVFAVTESQVVEKMISGLCELVTAAAQLPALPSR